jgi:hypothetical protein
LSFKIAFLSTLTIILLIFVFGNLFFPQQKQNLQATPDYLTVDTQTINWGRIFSGGHSTRTVTATSTCNANLSVALANCNYVDLDRYLTITVTPDSLMANQTATLQLTLTCKPNTPALNFNADIILTAQEAW